MRPEAEGWAGLIHKSAGFLQDLACCSNIFRMSSVQASRAAGLVVCQSFGGREHGLPGC